MLSEVHNTDCLEYMRSLPDKAFDLAIADPPYGGGQKDGFYHRFGNPNGRFEKYMRVADGRDLGIEVRKKIVAWDVAPGKEFFDELSRISRNQIIWGANYFPNMPPTRCFVVWRKLTISEKFTMAMCEYAWTSFDNNAKFVEIAPQGKATDTRFHPTQKPIELYAWCIRQFANKGGKIFDPMMGSQSSRIAAYKMGFDYVGCELDKEYFDKGCERFNRECLDIRKTDDGKTITQLHLFE